MREDPINRAVELMRLAAAYIKDSSDSDRIIRYDDADCDGYCLADDLNAWSDTLETTK